MQIDQTVEVPGGEPEKKDRNDAEFSKGKRVSEFEDADEVGAEKVVVIAKEIGRVH